jgi:hypothetical protein
VLQLERMSDLVRDDNSEADVSTKSDLIIKDQVSVGIVAFIDRLTGGLSRHKSDA